MGPPDVSQSQSPWFSEILAAALRRQELGPSQVTRVFCSLLDGQLGEAEIAGFLVAMRAKGETAGELAAAAKVLRQRMQRFDAGRDDVLDTCGPGGDGLGTFNISTAAAIIAAGAGVPVVKHGNRAVTSHCGSADVLAELGLPIERGLEWAKACMMRAGLAFCFAPQFHPALKHVGPLRRRLGVRTMFNLLGPLANPAEATYQLLGVGQIQMLDPLAGALAQLGIRQAFVVCGCDGMDEISLAGPTQFRRVVGDRVSSGEWTPRDFGLQEAPLDELKADGPAASARIIRSILAGEPSPAARVAVANAAAAIVTAERAKSLLDAVDMSWHAIRSGRAAQVLESMRLTGG